MTKPTKEVRLMGGPAHGSRMVIPSGQGSVTILTQKKTDASPETHLYRPVKDNLYAYDAPETRSVPRVQSLTCEMSSSFSDYAPSKDASWTLVDHVSMVISRGLHALFEAAETSAHVIVRDTIEINIDSDPNYPHLRMSAYSVPRSDIERMNEWGVLAWA